MRLVKYLLLPILLVGIYSCSQKENSTINTAKDTIVVNGRESTVFDPGKELVFTHSIQLETTSECLIKSIDKLFSTNEYIIIFDQGSNHIFQFDKTGRFIRQIGKKGQGPEEYLFFNDVIYDSRTNCIYAFERYRKQMYIYNMNGELLNAINSRYSFNSFIKTTHGYWIYSCFEDNNPHNHLLMLVDDSLSVVKKKYFPQAAFNIVHFTPRFTVNKSTEEYLFYYDGSDILWQLTDKATARFRVDFGEATLPYNEMCKMTNIKNYDKLIHGKYYMGFIDNVLISDSLLLFNCYNSGKNKPVSSYMVTYNHQSKDCHIYSSVRMKKGYIPVNYTKIIDITENNELVYITEPQRLFTSEFEDLQKLLPNITEEDNPILFYAKH